MRHKETDYFCTLYDHYLLHELYLSTYKYWKQPVKLIELQTDLTFTV